MQNCFSIEIVIDVVGTFWGIVFVFGNKDGFIDDDGLCFNLPPRINYESMKGLHFLVNYFVWGHSNLSEQLCNYFCAIDTSARGWAV